jgi:outer membrane murein-binding lipoprotein Lpp
MHEHKSLEHMHPQVAVRVWLASPQVKDLTARVEDLEEQLRVTRDALMAAKEDIKQVGQWARHSASDCQSLSFVA